MSVLTEELIESMIAHASANTEALAQTLNQCFDRAFRLDVGDSRAMTDAPLPKEFDGPGLMVLFQFDDEAAVVLVPTSLPLPDWYVAPGDSQKARLETLAMEWSYNLFPGELVVTKYGTKAALSLRTELERMAPASWAPCLELSVFSGGSLSKEPQAKLILIWPLTKPEFADPNQHTPASLGASAKPAASSPSANAGAAKGSGTASAPAAAPTGRLAFQIGADRLKKLPVNVSVRLAEKRLSLHQLLKLNSGSLIIFEKSSEDLLDLYVNNSIYARGEAVKIGENFGLKVNKVGVKPDEHHTSIIP